MRGGKTEVVMKDAVSTILIISFLIALAFLLQGNPSVFDKLREKTLQKLEVQQCENPST